jgi:hypothetical protein
MNNTKSNKIHRTACLAAVTALTAISAGNAFAGAFTPGNLVVERLGNGTETLGTTGNNIFFDEFTPTGAAQTPVQSIAIPTNAGANPMIEVGTGGTTGSITLTPDGETLVFPGYATNLPNTVTITGASTTVPRAIGALNGNGVYTQAATSTSAFSGSNIRGAASDGEGNFWAAGTASTTTVNSGLYYFGTTSAATDITEGNLRGVRIFNGTLWFTTDSSTPGIGIWQYVGQPSVATTPTQIITFVSSDSDYNFAVSPSGTVIYEADDGANGSPGIHKWTGSGTNFTLSYILLNSGGTNGTGCFGLTVNWNTTPPTLYATTTAASANTLIMTQDNGEGTTNFTVLATAGTKQFFRGVSFAPTNATVTPTPPTVTGISPASATVSAGGSAEFAVSAIGTPPLTYSWYQASATATNPVDGQTKLTLVLSNLFGTNAGSYFAVVSNASGLTSTSSVVSVSVIDPVIVENPANLEAFLSNSVTFDVSAVGTGLTYQWYYSDANGDPSSLVAVPSGAQADTSVFSGVTNTSLTWSNLQLSDAPTNFVVVVTGTYGMVTSAVATLEAVNSTNTVQQNSYASGTFDFNSILGFWNFNGSTFNNVTPPPFIGDGTASLVNLPAFATTVEDPNDGKGANFPFGQDSPNNSWGTSTYPASGSNLLSGVQFNVSTLGARNISVIYDSRASGTASLYEHLQYTVDGLNWSNYPASTTFGIGHSGSGNGGFGTYQYSLAGFPGVDNNASFGIRVVTEFQNSATYGAGYHALLTNNYVGTANTYGTAGTVTYDIVEIDGDDIADNNTIPTVSCDFPTTNLFNNFPITNTLDNVPITVNLTVGSVDMPASNLTLSATALGIVTENGSLAPTANASFTFSGTGANRTMTINPSPIEDSIDAAPILVTVTDTNGLVGQTWFYLTLTTQFPPPTNSLVLVTNTNMLADTSLSIPFVAGTTNVALSSLTFGATSDNTGLVPNANMVFTANPVTNTNAALTNVILTITPTNGQLGAAVLNITVSDNNPADPKSTTSSTVLQVRPNTNVVLIDYFGYSSGGPMDQVNPGLWSHLSGILNNLKVDVSPDTNSVLVDCVDNTENLQAPLVGGPYAATGTNVTVLYSSFIMNLNPNGAVNGMPTGNGSYFMVFNDGTGVTGDYECGVYAVTNGAAPGNYRIGIENWAGNGNENFSSVPIVAQDLVPGSNYVVVTALVLSNGQSRLWLNPISQTSPSVTDTVTAGTADATLFSIVDLELRESSSESDPLSSPGIIAVSRLKVGTTFDSVFPSPHIQSSGTNVVVTWSDPTLGILSSTNVAGPYAPVVGGTPPYTNSPTNSAEFFILTQ